MKKIWLFFLIISFNAFSIELSEFNERFPSFSDYELNSLVASRAYFKNLFIHSVVQSDLDGSINLLVRNDDWETTLRVRIFIQREISDYEIVETVNYVLSNGNHFEYILRRAGKNLRPLLDKDLLMFKFQAEEDLDYYEILIPSLGIDYSRSLNMNNESAFFIIGAIGLELRIETKILVGTIERQYIFNSINNQNIFLAKIDKDLNEYLNFNYGERISSIKFYNELSTSAAGINDLSNLYLSNLYSLGFPKFN